MDGDQLMLLGLAIVVVPFAFLLFLAIGPPGWLLVGAFVFAAGLLVKFQEEPDQGIAVSGVNCPDCGARNDADDEECHHCGTALETPESSEA